MSSELQKNRRNKYKKIEQSKRLQIIGRINSGEQLKVVSESVGINVSTCKTIIKVYQEEGRVGKKKTRNKIVDVVETYSFYIMEGGKMVEISPLKIVNSKVSVEQKQEIEDIIQDKCKEKGKQLLAEAVANYSKAQEAPKPVVAVEPTYFPTQPNYVPFGFYPSFS